MDAPQNLNIMSKKNYTHSKNMSIHLQIINMRLSEPRLARWKEQGQVMGVPGAGRGLVVWWW